MRYVHEFVDKMACMRCPHNAPATEENGWEGFDFVCYAREDGDEFLFPEECPTYFGPWGAWRAVVGQMVERMEWIDDCDEWQVAWAISTYLRQWIRSDLDAVGWSP